jgi:xanthine dehydrogenase large subunit
MKHIDGAYHVTGKSEYVDDVLPPDGMLHAAVVGSTVAHARIIGIDLAAARDIEGIHEIILASDIPGENQIGPLIPDEPLLASTDVHFIGQPIAIVVAQSPADARRGAGAVKVGYEELEVTVDPRIAFAAGEIIGSTRTFEIGDVDSAWKDCVYVVDGCCDVGGQEHVYLETHRSRAIPQEGGRIVVHSSTQGPYAAQKAIARVLGKRNTDIEVDVKRIGGGFGGKEDQSSVWACVAALAAWKMQKPVEIVLRRDEDLRMTGKRHPYASDFRIGADSSGKILAYQAWHYQNAGAAADLSPPVLERTLFHSTNAYFVPNARIFGASCRTNLPPNTAFRGFGGPQGMFVMESALTRLADEMDRPREEIQRINLIRDGESFPYGQIVRNGCAERTWDELDTRHGLPSIRQAADEHNRNHFDSKKGLAVMPVCFGISFTTTWMNQASALVHVYTDGSVAVSTGGVEMGQGLSTNILEIASRAFGISADRIRIESTNTTRVANSSPSAASATTVLNGNATIVAIREIKNRLADVARNELQLGEAVEIGIEAERVTADGAKTDLDWPTLILKAYTDRVALSASGFYATPGIHFDRSEEKGSPFAYHAYGAAVVEVTVDCLRGTYEVDAVKIVHDLGRPLNELVDLGQVEGGLAQGLGWMTMEDLQYDEKGRLLSSGLATYKVPDSYFMPDDIQVNFLENADEPTGPYGNKAVGEPPLMYGIGVWFAIRDAMRAFKPGLEIPYASPMTPERVLMALFEGAPDLQNQHDVVLAKSS